jgi:DNA-binding MarR family transcriptional regulator
VDDDVVEDRVPLVRLLTMAVTVALDELHGELARHGHGSLRPVHGYALNAVLSGHHTTSAMAPLLGMTKQGAARIVQHLVDGGYLDHGSDPDGDGRRKPLRLTARGTAVIKLSVQVQQRMEQDWAELTTPRTMASARRALEQAVTEGGRTGFPVVRPGW